MATLQEIEKEILNGTLKMRSVNFGTKHRRKYIYSKNIGTDINGYFVPDIERVETLKYPDIRYRAEYTDGRGYRISKKVYKNMTYLLKVLAEDNDLLK